MIDFEKTLQALISDGCPMPATLEVFGSMVDWATDTHDEALLMIATEAAPAICEACTGTDAPNAKYMLANAWSALRHIRRHPAESLSWHQPELFKEILQFRSALQCEDFENLEISRKAEIYCNLGNALNASGRVIDAIEQWEKALKLHPGHSMARGNLGVGLHYYSQIIYDKAHSDFIFMRARAELQIALAGDLDEETSMHPAAQKYFSEYLATLNKRLTREPPPLKEIEASLSLHEMGTSQDEALYRSWCLERKLFLNPMNDVFTVSAAAADVLNFPSHRGDESGITYLAFFNQIKQEYIYARWCFYEGVNSYDVHFADKDVTLTSNGDFAKYSISQEKVKTAFRAAYSLLDKVAYFVNAYFDLGIPETQVSFPSIWKEKKGPRKGELFTQLESSGNHPLHALYSLSKDISDSEMTAVAAPDSDALKDMRNHLEHKYLKIIDSFAKSLSVPAGDNLAYTLTEDELSTKTERLIRIARSALTYLCLAVHRAELLRPAPDGQFLSIDVQDIPDELKY